MADIILQNINLHYPDQQQAALFNINLTIPDDGITVVVGPSGCGKTSLLNTVAGFLQPTEGQMTRNQQLIREPASDRVVVFQDDALMPWLNVYENVALGLRINGYSQEDEVAIVEDKLQKVGLIHAIEKDIWALSGGMRQRVGIAGALAIESDYILMDEPFGALDAASREQMQSLILNLWQKKLSAFFVITHDIEEALILATQLVLMAPFPGRVLTIEKPLFHQEWLDGKSIRQIKADKAFIDYREHLLDRLAAHQIGQYEVSI